MDHAAPGNHQRDLRGRWNRAAPDPVTTTQPQPNRFTGATGPHVEGMPMLKHTDEFDPAIIQHVREILGPDWLEESGLDGYPPCPEGTDPREWKAFIDAIPPFDPPTEAELDAMADAYGE